MRYKRIGETDVPAIGQGTGGIYDANIIKVGIDLGMTLIDTAESYGNEDMVGKAIKGQRDKVFISTKFSPEHNGYDDVIKACEGSLKRLGTDYIDLYSMYYRNPYIPEEETEKAPRKLLSDGKVKYVGVCNTFTPFIAGIEIQSVQAEYNLFDRSVEETLLPYCTEHGIALLAYSPLRDFYQLNPDSMIQLRELDGSKTLSQLILNWLISHMPVIALTSSTKIEHIKKNAESSDFSLSEADIEKIGQLFKPGVTKMPLERIDITLSVDKFPQTKEQAITWDKWAVKPQDVDLKDFKPIKVEKSAYGEYELKEGGLRYWAWVIQKNEPIPTIIKHRWILDFKGQFVL